MNFGWMVDQIETPIAFWLLGFLGPIAVAVAMLAPLGAPVSHR